MSSVKKSTALIGSTRGLRTTSESIVNYLNGIVETKGLEIEKFRAYQIFSNSEKLAVFIKQLEQSDLLLISASLYVDSLSYPLMKVLEELDKKVEKEFWENKKMMAVIHSGYPEPVQRQTALDICRCFAEEVGVEWLGGIGFGATSIINGKPLEEMGWFTKGMRMALGEVGKTLIDSKEIPDRAVELSNKNPMPLPLWLMKPLLNMMVKRNAGRKGIDIYSRPYQE